MYRLTILAAWVAALIPARAWAGPVESPGEIVVSPSDPKLWIVRWDNGGGGLLYSGDGGGQLASDVQ